MRALFARLTDPPSEDAEFDPAFYKRNYSDLRHLRTNAGLHDHYRRHGMSERRFPSLVAARAYFEAVSGPPPEDFDVRIYQDLNPDLAKLFTDPVQYELHYLEFGRFENRPYGSANDRPENIWQRVLDLYDFNLLNESWLPPGGVSRAGAVAAMKDEGIARMAPIARGWAFDPAFYRAQYSVKGDDAELYRDWLYSGLPASRAPNETQAIAHLLAGKAYPEAFDWKQYCRSRKIKGASPIPAKLKALETLFEQPLDDRARACVVGLGAGRLYENVGNYNLVRARHRQAAEAFRLAIETSGPSSRLLLRLGDALKALEDPLDALESFRAALEFPDCSIWALSHAADIMLSQEMFDDASRLVEANAVRFKANEHFDRLVDDVAERSYRAVSDAMYSLLRSGESDEAVDRYAESRLSEVTTFLRKTKVGEARPKLEASGSRRFVMLACLDLAQCTFYRVEQKRRLLADLGVELEVFDFKEPSRFMSALPGAAAAIFYRVPCYPKIVEAILYSAALGVETFFDIDDLIFTRDFPDSFESYENQIGLQEYLGLRHGVALYKEAISLCRGAIVSTRSLAKTIAPMVIGGAERTFVVPNGLDDRSERATRFVPRKAAPSDTLSIFYGSGTKAHNRDFSEIVAPALVDVLERHPNVRLVIVGHLRLGKAFRPYEAQIARLPFIGDLDTYWGVLASCDINISVLHAGPIADGKSEIKWLEAAMLTIPSIVSATATYQDVLTDGVTGLLAHDSDHWRRHLDTLIEDGALRRTMGVAARELAMREYDAAAIAAKLETALADRDSATDMISNAPRRARVLIVNVYFAPQSVGGATRVVEDNLEQLLERYGDEFEISVLSTYKGLNAGALRVDGHCGCSVYRIGTPLEVNMDWRPFNDEVLPAFRRVLEVARPDLVHFHCVRRLTASIVEETLSANIPYVVTVHDAWWISDHQFLIDQDGQLAALNDPFRTLLPSGVTRPESLSRLQRLKGLLNAAEATLAVSASFADLYRSAGIDNVRTCENGLGPLGAPRAKTTPPDKIVLGHIGGRSNHKGAGLIETVLKRGAFRNLELVMVDGTFDAGEEQVEMWGSTPVTLRAPVERDDVDQLYSGMDVVLAPSIWPESYGLVVREALHFRSWVVTSDRGALAQPIVPGANGFVVDPSSSNGLAAVLAQIDDDVARFKNPPQATELRRSSQQLDDIVTVYREILCDERKARAARARLPAK